MKKFLQIFGIIIGCWILIIVGLKIGFQYVSHDENKIVENDENNNIRIVNESEENLFEITSENINDYAKTIENASHSYDKSIESISDVSETNSLKIKNTALLIYEYHDINSDSVTTHTEKVPYFLAEKTKEEFKLLYEDYEILSFDENEIVLKKEIDKNDTVKNSDEYIVGIKDRKIAVFFKNYNNGDNIKEITDTSVNILPKEEQQQLLYGIEVSGEDELIKILEAYGS